MQVRYFSFIAVAIVVVMSVVCSKQANSQTDTLKVMYYNILNFPDDGDPDRELAFQKINGYINADVILVNELTSDAGGVTLLTEALNVFGENSYEKAVFTDGPDTDNMLFYNSDKLALYSQHYIVSWPRYIDEYVLYYKSAGLSSGEDTIFFYFYSAHLKANSGETATRLTEVNNFKTRVNGLANAENIIFGGDMNIYTNAEPAYSALINDGVYPLNDPLPAGEWHNNYSLRQYHTQSTRTSQFGGGSTGGMDDRFDFILFSDDVLTGINGATYMDNSCFAFGNDGAHYNKALTDLPGNPNLPDSIIQALYYMSDHLPVICDIKVNATTAVYAGPPDIVITEIMYNPPEVGLDSLEFVELYNKGSETVDLAGCHFTNGIEFSFPSTIIQPGEFVTIAYSSQSMLNTFGTQSMQWTSGGLNNGGEAIVLKDNYGYTIDSVYYDDTSPWPTQADGNGNSLVLCNPDLNNSLGSNWQVSQNYITNNENGDPIFATPLSTECAFSIIADFSASQLEVNTGESVLFTDESVNNPTSWNWIFEGGEPSTSSMQNPIIVYNSTGLFDVQLSVSNADGSDVLLREDYITVLNNNPVLMITEIMQNPSVVGDSDGEWFEVFNPTNNDIDMYGWRIQDEGSDSHTIGSSVIVPANDFAVLGNNDVISENGGYSCDYVFSSFFIANGEDEILIFNPQDEEIDRVTYDGGPDWPDPTGASMVFIGTATDDNNDFNLWETATVREQTYLGTIGDNGSPGLNGTVQNLVLPEIGFELQLKVYLEGPFKDSEMNTNSLELPTSQPFNISPWNYNGLENVLVTPPSIADWILVELRDATSAQNANTSTVLERKAAYLLNDGSVVGIDGNSNLYFEDLSINESLFVVIYHRNHLAIMSAFPLIKSAGKYLYDFTNGITKAYESGQKEIKDNVFAMYAADGNSDRLIDSNDQLLWINQAGEQGYKAADFDVNGEVNNKDKNDMWFPNLGTGSQVPQ